MELGALSGGRKGFLPQRTQGFTENSSVELGALCGGRKGFLPKGTQGFTENSSVELGALCGGRKGFLPKGTRGFTENSSVELGARGGAKNKYAMKMKYMIIGVALSVISCSNNGSDFDATGNFEADEVIVSAEAAGKILKLDVDDGKELKKGQVVGYIDTTQLALKKKQLKYSILAVMARKPNTSTQLAAINEQIETATREKKRIENLFKEDAATQKQLDDINSQLEVLQKQYNATKSSLDVTTQSLNSEALPLKAQLEQVEDQIQKSVITNPIDGIVLTEYLMEDEVAGVGKGLYKIANLNTIILRAYVSGSQLSQIKIGQPVDVFVDSSEDEYKKYNGTVSWVSDKAEFTPKTIQTKEERANLVYAVKINVKNDGYLKIGMYGEVKLNPAQ